MKYKNAAYPAPWKGLDREWVKEVVPDQTIKLQEILRRFVRGEALPLGKPTVYGSEGEIDPESDSEFNVDQEKAAHWDLTERDEFAEKVRIGTAEYEKAEAEKKRLQDVEAAEAARKADEKRIRLAAQKLAKKQGSKTPGI